MRLVKRFPAMVIAICFILGSINIAFAAVDCDDTARTLADYTSGDLPLASIPGNAPVKTLSVTDTSVVDETAAAGDQALRFANTDGAGTVLAGRGVEVITLTNDAALHKHIHFDMYVPEAEFYGNLRTAYSRYATNFLTTANVGYINEMEFSSANRSEGWTTVVNLKNNANVTGGSVSLANRQWHSVDLFINERATDFYIDGSFVCRVTGAEGTGTAGFSYGALGFHLLPGYNNSDIIYDGANAGVYFDNIKVKQYDSADVRFCGTAVQNGSEIKVYFTEPVAEGQDAAGVSLYNTETGEVTEMQAALECDVMTVTLSSPEALSRGTEYMLDMPDTFRSIRGKDLYSDIYFQANSFSPAHVIDFESYTTDVETVTGGVITGFTSSQGAVCRQENLQAAVSTWMNAGLIGVKDFHNLYSDYGNVMALRYNPDSGRGYQEVRSGVLLLNWLPNLANNSAAVEFDMMIPDRSRLDYLYIQPYALNSAYAAGSGAEVNHGGIVSSGGCQTANTQYAHIIAPDQYNARFNVHKGGTVEHRGSATDSSTAYDHSAVYTDGDWCTVKITIVKTGDNAYETKFYLDNELVSTVTDMAAADRTDEVRGVRFTYQPVTTLTNVTNLAYFDNFKVSLNPDEPKVLKTRIYNRDGEAFGMLSDGVKASAAQADIYLNGAVDASEAVVTLVGAGETITTACTYDNRANKLAAVFDSLLKTSTAYTLSVTGLKAVDGTAVAAYSAAFTSSAEEEFEVTLALTDAAGNELTDSSGLSPGDVVYIRSEAFNTTSEAKTIEYIAAAYNGAALAGLGHGCVTVNTGEKLWLDKNAGNAVSVTVNDLANLKIRGFAWDGFTNVIPLVSAVTY